MSDDRKLNVVDEDENIVGVETRENIHKIGLLHREIHIWFYTPQGEIIFQHRAKDKDTYPGLLDATVGGHVEIGDDYMGIALKEVEEETGVRVEEGELQYLKTDRSSSYDNLTGKKNNVIRTVYAYCYTESVSDLRVEDGKAIGFESWPLDTILDISDDDRKRFIPTIFEHNNLESFNMIRNLL